MGKSSRYVSWIATGLLAFLVAAQLGCGSAVPSESARDDPESRSASPLTGLPLQEPDSANSRAYAVKVENDPAARPQSGLGQAELVYEEMVEGGVTRFIAIYLDAQVSEIGPIRSVRPMDINVLQCIDPLLVTSGGSPGVMNILEQSSLLYLPEEGNDQYFRRTRDRRAPHNLYTSTAQLDAAVQAMGLGSREWRASLFVFEGVGAGQEAKSIAIGYPAACAVSYDYDAASNSYLRWLAGSPHVDKLSGLQVAPSTVIVQYIELEDTGVRDMAGALSPDAVVIGQGDALVFSGGRASSCKWVKASASTITRYLDEAGNDISVQPGSVWVHLIPKSIKVDYSEQG